MNERRFTRVARWLATHLSTSDSVDEGDWASSAIRHGAELGFSETVVRAAAGEIGAIVERYGTPSERWSLDAHQRQAWMRWAAANRAPTPGAGRDVYVGFWAPPGSPVIEAARASVEAQQRADAEAERRRRWAREAASLVAGRQAEERERLARYRREAEQLIAQRAGTLRKGA